MIYDLRFRILPALCQELELTEEDGLLPIRRTEGLEQEAAELTAIFAAIHKSSKS
jgi:hypothetical protein